MTTPNHFDTPCDAQPSSRRGVLLLVVLSMLTLFLMLGTAYLVVSTRSRQTARAFAKLSMQSESTRIPHAPLLDAAFLRVVRGGTSFSLSSAPPPGVSLPAVFESLLEDKYGSSTSGTATLVNQLPNAPLLQIRGTISGYPPLTSGSAGPAGLEAITDFPGRVITLLGASREPTSHRIIRSDTTAGLTLYVDLRSGIRPFRIPTGDTPFIINGPEYQIHRTISGTTTNEAWDAFDDSNAFLAQITPGTSIASTVMQKIGLVDAANSQTLLTPKGTSQNDFGATTIDSRNTNGFAYGADNDGDGNTDGLFIDVGLPTQFTPSGDPVNYDVSALIVDLDSRYNVNAHGSLSPYAYSADATTPHSGWVASGTTSRRVTWSGSTSTTGTVENPSILGLPVGSGYGPAEVNGAWMFPASAYPNAGPRDSASPPTSTYALLTLSGASQASQSGLRPSGSRFVTGTYTPRLSNVEGRYGEGIFATTASVDDLVNTGPYYIANPGFPLGLPGAPRTDDRLSQFSDRGVSDVVSGTAYTGGAPTTWWSGNSSYNWITSGTVIISGSAALVTTRGSYNSPPDLHGRMITTTFAPSANDVIPRLAYAKPEWGGTETQDDPYEVRLDPKAPRNAQYTTIGTAVDNIFNVAELEPLLRPYDRDTLQLPQRLSAILGGISEEARLRVTTDSWDTTAITGTAASNIRDWMRQAASLRVTPLYGSSAVTGLIGGEVARGERFNLNRPFTSFKPPAYSATHPYYLQRQAYFKDLYTLMVALSGTTSPPPSLQTRQKYAQWAANVVEFRDEDSTMTPFEYDTNPSDGWTVNGDVMSSSGEADRAVIWGSERPEAIIAATSAWESSTTGEMFILLHRPWNALAFSRSGVASEAVPGEPIDVELDVIAGSTGKDLLDLSRKSAGRPFNPSDAATYPVWRLRIVDGLTGATSYVRFDISTSGAANELVAPTLASPYAMATDSWQCVMGTNTPGLTVPSSTNPTFAGFVPPGSRPAPNTTLSGSATVYLERLTDPRAVISNAVWNAPPGNDDPAASGTVAMYKVVDEATMEIANREPPAPLALPANPYSVTYRPGPGLWCWPSTGPSAVPNATSMQSSYFARAGGTYAPLWFPWNNRLFVSSAELYLVPGSDPNAPGGAKDALGLLQQYVYPGRPAQPAMLPAISGTFIPNGLFDAVHVPTRFSGIHTTIATASGMTALENAGIYADTLSANQLSSFREPGRVNLNTVTGTDVWNAVVAGALQTSGTATPVRTGAQANFISSPAKGMHNLLSLSGLNSFSQSGTAPPVQDSHPLLAPLQSLNPAHNIYTATRLANTATVRSNVFGIWITVRESVANDPDSIKLHRAFYVFDRSIPVAFEPGKDHNVWDAVLLRRIIQ